MQRVLTAGEALRDARLAHGKTMRELGEVAGCSHVHIFQVEHGEKPPSPRVLRALSAALGLSYPELARAYVKDLAGAYEHRAAKRYGVKR